ncbi:stage II sporulation protein R [Priestia megaterium]|nr:stage II sporulation protein R [Priestia megaterium]
MKKYAIIYFLLLIIGANTQLLYTNQHVNATQPTVIPNEAIRLRILANSDGEKDQHVKRLIRDEVNAQITTWVQDLTSVREARKIIKSNLPELESIAKNVLQEQGVTQSVHVDFGEVSFPTKLYGQFLYPAGDYEAVLITLGKGEGANWWCVLFPPLCFLDFSNGEAIQSPMPADAQSDELVEEPLTDEPKDAASELNTFKQNESTLVASTETIAEKLPSDSGQHLHQNQVHNRKQSEQKNKKNEEVEVKFFLAEWASSLF